MEEKRLDPAPVWSDLATFDGVRWRGVVDLVTASPPCQPYSTAGLRRGLEDERGGAVLGHLARVIEECRPGVVFLENVWRWWSGGYFRNFGERLFGMGYRILPPLRLAAGDVGAPHRRERGWCLAYRECAGRQERGTAHHDDRRHAPGHDVNGRDPKYDMGSERVPDAQRDTLRIEPERGPRPTRPAEPGDAELGYLGGDLSDTGGEGLPSAERAELPRAERHDEGRTVAEFYSALFPPGSADADRWRAVLERRPELAPALESTFCRVVDGVAYRMDGRGDRLRCTGNGVVPLVGALAFDVLMAEAGL